MFMESKVSTIYLREKKLGEKVHYILESNRLNPNQIEKQSSLYTIALHKILIHHNCQSHIFSK